MLDRLSREMDEADANIRAYEARKTEITKQQARIESLAKTGYASRQRVDEVQSAYTSADAARESAQARLDRLQSVGSSAKQGIFLQDGYNDTPYSQQQGDRLVLSKQKLEGEIPQERTRLTQLDEEIQTERTRVERSANYRLSLPADQVARTITTSPGSPVVESQSIMDMANCENRFVIVELPERDFESVSPGGHAKIRLLGSNTDGKIRYSSSAALWFNGPMNLRRTIVIGGYLALYIVLDWMSLIHPTGSLNTLGITPWNPPAGLSLALLLRYGPAMGPAVFVAVAVSDILFLGLSAAPYITLASALTVAIGYSATAAVLRRQVPISTNLQTHRDLLVLLAVSLAATMMVAAAVVAILAAGGLLQWSEFPKYALHYWVGDIIGIAGFTPLILLMMDPQRRASMLVGARSMEFALQLGAIILGLWIIFGWESTNHFQYSYVLFLPLIWIGLRGGLARATWGILATQLGLVAAIQFRGFDVAVTTQFQLLMLAVAVTGLVLGSIVDEEQRAESSLRDSETRLQTVVETAPDAILTFDETGVITSANPAAGRMFAAPNHWPENLTIRDLLAGLDMVEPDSVTGSDMIAYRLNGTSFTAEVGVGKASASGRALYVAVVRDMSIREQAEVWLKEHEAELAHASRLTATGEMAASLAHELNQPLTAVVSFARACQATLRNMGRDDEQTRSAQSLIDQAVEQALRAGEIIRATREFLRRGDARTAKVDVAQIFKAVYGLVKAEAALNQVRIVIRFERDTPPVLADAIQIEQVILNLIRNSMEAMAQVPPDKREIRLSASLDDGEPGFVVFALQDTGPGFAPEAADSMFKPFSTTKSTGMGLGLSISRSIVEAHGGRIWNVAGGPADGADIRFTLPSYTGLKSEP